MRCKLLIWGAACLLISLLPFSQAALAQTKPWIETRDIARFWIAFDGLAQAKTAQDSIEVIEREYIQKASPDLKEFIRLRNFTAAEYQYLIRLYPNYWRSVRALTESVSAKKQEIEDVFKLLGEKLPNFKRPRVCIAIGCMRTGASATRGQVWVGAEIAMADSSVNQSELSKRLRNILINKSEMVSLIAHETIHTQQKGFPLSDLFSVLKHGKWSLLQAAMVEGSADFITDHFLGLNINRHLQPFGLAHKDSIMRTFFADYKKSPYTYSDWLFSHELNTFPPKNIGYFIGYQISAEYYKKSEDKRQAMQQLLNRKQYRYIWKQIVQY